MSTAGEVGEKDVLYVRFGRIRGGPDEAELGEHRLHSLAVGSDERHAVPVGSRGRALADDEELGTDVAVAVYDLLAFRTQAGTVLTGSVHPERVRELVLMCVHGCRTSGSRLNDSLGARPVAR
jgi:hypothetical protein